jgi:hypothetical protein
LVWGLLEIGEYERVIRFDVAADSPAGTILLRTASGFKILLPEKRTYSPEPTGEQLRILREILALDGDRARAPGEF